MKPLTTWHTPATDYPRRKVGSAEIRQSIYPPGHYESYMTNGERLYQVKEGIPVTELRINRRIWMVDDPPHWWAMIEHARHYHGHVVCAGLGLGLIVHTLTLRKNVTNVTVIERNKDVIKMVRPLIPYDFEVIEGDFWEVARDLSEEGTVDGVFYDLFVGKGKDLMSAAMRVWIDLRELFPLAVRRIHGFPSEMFASLDKVMDLL